MNKSLFRDTLRTISRTSPRFFSVVAIVALGVSFFAGLNATAPDMYNTAQHYYKDTNAMDVRVISTAGLTEDDAAVIKSIQGVESVTGEKYVDGKVLADGESLSDIDGSQLSVRVIALDMNKALAYQNGADDKSYVNRPQLVKGRLPSAENECLVDASTLSTPEQFKLGTVITVVSANTDVTEELKNTDYTVVGVIRTPLFISYERGTTSVGTGKLGTFIYAPSTNFTSNYYSSLSIKLAGSENFDPYSDDYKAFVKPYLDYIQSISQERLSLKIPDLKAEYAGRVEKGEEEFALKKTQIESQIAEGEQQVQTILEMAESGEEKLAEYKRQYNEKAVEAGTTIEKHKLDHSEQYAKWEAKRNEYNEAKALVEKYATAETDYKNAVTQYNVATLNVNTMLTTVSYLETLVATTRSSVDQLRQNQGTSANDIKDRFNATGLTGPEFDQIMTMINGWTAVGTAEEMAAYMEPQLQDLEARLTASKEDLNDAKAELAKKKAELDKAAKLVEKLKEVSATLDSSQAELDKAEKELTNAGNDIQFGELEVLSQLSDLKNQITSYETNLQLAKAKAPTVHEDYAKAKAEALSKLDSARARLDHAKNFLLGLDNPKWYVHGREDALYGYEEYRQTAERTKALSTIFPWFFFLVASLVCLNTMTRMVEDERTQLGTLKALGFVDSEIVLKYIIYAFTASFFGAVAGTFLGFAIFPTVLTSAYGILFDMPPLILSYRFSYAFTGILISILTTVGASYIASRRSLRTPASALMRPKAPKAGKRVFLEKYPKLWSKLSFNSKITARNVLRNKKRFIMAVIGVMGCMSLLVAGFGLDNSIHAVSEKQFMDKDSISKYDMQVILNGSFDTTANECKIYNKIVNRSEIESGMLNYMKVLRSTNDKGEKEMETYLYVPERPDEINRYIVLRDKHSKNEIPMPDNGAVITDKLASQLKLSVGDYITAKLDDDKTVKIPVAAIAENYTFHYIYMTPTVYAALFGENVRYNYVMANFSQELTDEQKVTLSTQLLSEYEISSVAYSSEIQEMLQHSLNSLGYVVLILVICAGLLSLIVLYNLSTININERIKEIATIKVLGFTKAEVSAYIFRENMILTVLGTFLGLFTGLLLHRAVIKIGEVDIVMFGRSVGFAAIIYSVVLSIGFSLLVNLILRRNLKNVSMVESLKSIE